MALVRVSRFFFFCVLSLGAPGFSHVLHLPSTKINDLTFDIIADTTRLLERADDILPRDTCRVIQVSEGDDCGKLATRCGISGNDFMTYNTKTNLCSTLMPGQWVCCSKGTLPDYTPKPNPDGSCFAYQVQKNDGCWSIAASHTITQDVIEKNNNDTWGWAGCDALIPDQLICLSSGAPPMPLPIENAVCGPQVPGTQKPTDGKKLADLNPCLLNACCDIWGQCGTTVEFCVPTPAKTGAPGTALPNTNGCISNCGTDVVNNGSPPASFSRVGFFEAWNSQRSCLHMDASQIDTGFYTHIHFAFATLTPDFQVNITGLEDQFAKFKTLNTKRILSFGGWTFSTDPGTYWIFRSAVTAANRLTFANNVVAFLNQHGLDGLDFDWECGFTLSQYSWR